MERSMGHYLFNLLSKQPGVNVSHQKEDCLYLNIYVPEGRPPIDSGGWPVIIWFHPGDFSSGSPVLWDPTAFVIKQKVVVVTPSYRLDIFGFMSLENDDIPGNFGLMDQAASMDWVQDHIGFFNGSKNDVMIWGHSAGGTSVTLHLASESTPKKFHKAVAMSGNAFLPGSVVEPRRNIIVNYFLQQEYGCNRDKIETCLRNLDYTALKKASDELPAELPEEWGPWRWGPVVDGYFVEKNPFLKDDPKEVFITKRAHKVPLMIGFTDMEDLDVSDLDNIPVNKKTFKDSVSKVFYDELQLEAMKMLGNDSGCALNEEFVVNSILFHYTPSSPDLSEDQTLFRKRFIELLTDRNFGAGTYALGKATSASDSFTYLYRFDYKMKSTGMSVNRDWVGVPHQYELPIFWGMPYWTTINPPVIWNNIDKKISDIVMGLLGNFSRYSVPIQNKKTTPWERFSELNQRLLIIDKTFNMSDSSSFDYKNVDFWNDYYPTVLEAASYCCNSTAAPSVRPGYHLLGVTSVVTLLFNIESLFDQLRIFLSLIINYNRQTHLYAAKLVKSWQLWQNRLLYRTTSAVCFAIAFLGLN
ncbi:unnamed protein product [Nesidiocoris tenuis]|uniref:Carboxylesterase type B domain-containing protein n=1 Tax=Nesidiocoris tenuis TaxID=355587 RepID=A0A6H5G6Q7_9HEMI|nr:unnamed protein product [Nesidiocoris tenuis]